MKVVILAGGLGTRISEFTHLIPKPMIDIGGSPIIYHIMNYYASFGHTEFVIALGYKSQVIKEYFLDFSRSSGDFSLNLRDSTIRYHRHDIPDWSISFIETGADSQTGGRLLRLKDYLDCEPFMLTYGDGIANVDVKSLVEFHNKHNSIATVTAVRPPARFGELFIENDIVTLFKEKPQLEVGYINGGFFVFEQEIFNYLENDSTILESGPLESLAKQFQLQAFIHDSFWYCMDTVRDHAHLNSLYRSGGLNWLTK